MKYPVSPTGSAAYMDIGAVTSSTSALSSASSEAGGEVPPGGSTQGGGGAYMDMAPGANHSGLSLSPVQERLGKQRPFLSLPLDAKLLHVLDNQESVDLSLL